MSAHRPEIGFIGLGVMGRPMALNVIKAGYRLVFYNRSPRPSVDELKAAGAEQAQSPSAVAARCPVVITMLADTPDVEEVVGGTAGVLESVQPDGVIIDMSTIAPAAAQRLAREAEQRGAWMLDAPVSGGEIGAVNGTLSIMVGGPAAIAERVRPVLETMGQKDRVVYIGPSGAGQLTKACNQLVLAVTLGGVSEAFALARKAGVDPARMRAALLGGFAQSRVLEVHGQRMLDGNYVPGFRASLFDKDLRIVLGALAEDHVPAPVSAAASQLVAAMIAAGEGQDDYSAMARSVFRLAHLP
ncbi:MAG: NAD(P)-dependent oxidoreductase, partial [Vicinamibacterales bacterium]